MIRLLVLAGALAGSLAGCQYYRGVPPPTTGAAFIPYRPGDAKPQPATSAPKAADADPNATVDGLYKGPETMTKNTADRCGTPGRAVVRITNAVLDRKYSPSVTLQAKVQPDGSFSDQAGGVSLDGDVQGGHLDADIGDDSCRYHWSLDRF